MIGGYGSGDVPLSELCVSMCLRFGPFDRCVPQQGHCSHHRLKRSSLREQPKGVWTCSLGGEATRAVTAAQRGAGTGKGAAVTATAATRGGGDGRGCGHNGRGGGVCWRGDGGGGSGSHCWPRTGYDVSDVASFHAPKCRLCSRLNVLEDEQGYAGGGAAANSVAVAVAVAA